MDKKEILKQIEDKAFLDKIYQFSYFRCNTSYEAEDLCSDIILAVLSAINNQDQIENLYAFVWSIAKRVYADFSKKRSKTANNISMENVEPSLPSKENEIDLFLEDAEDAARLKGIFAEIAFLSEIYRDVMVMYYIDELQVKEIAVKLGISETTVKQRLFSARHIIRKEVESMNERNLSLKPILFSMIGTGNIYKNDPRIHVNRTLSRNLIYLCKDKPKSIKELSDELCVPTLYVEEELFIQCHGENGKYGMLRKLENGKYITNVLVVDYDEYDQANKIYGKFLPEIFACFEKNLRDINEELLNFPYLSEQNDTRFILWLLLTNTIVEINNDINLMIHNKYFSNIKPTNRSYSVAVIAYEAETEADVPQFAVYGCDGNHATHVGGFEHVFISNVYGKRLDRHFTCGHNISQDKKLLMLLKAIGGLCVDALSEAEKEVAAKCIECGYLRKNGNILEPRIIVIDQKDQKDFFAFSHCLQQNMQDVKEKIAEELAIFMKNHIPEHLMNEYHIYTQLFAGTRIYSALIEACIEKDLLLAPENQLGAEGVLMIVKKD